MVIKSSIRYLDNLVFDWLGPIRVLFVIRNNISFDCLIPLIRRIEGDKHFSLSITIEHEGCFSFASDNYSQYLKDNFYVRPDNVAYKKWHYVFLTDVTDQYFSRDTTVVCTTHASCFGNLDVAEGNRSVDYLTQMTIADNVDMIFFNSYSAYQLVLKESKGKIYESGRQFLITGFIRSGDMSINVKRSDRESILKQYQLDIDKPVVLITSHWTSKSLFNNIQIQHIEALLKCQPDYQFLAMGHILLWENHDGQSNNNPLYIQFKQLDDQYANFFFQPGVKNISEISAIADYFVLDYTSYFVDACMKNKPILFYDNPNFNFLDPMVGGLYKASSTTFSDPQNMRAAFSDMLNKDDDKQQYREQLVAHFLYQPEHVVEYIVFALKEMGKLSGRSSARWNNAINFCRKEFANFKGKTTVVDSKEHLL